MFSSISGPVFAFCFLLFVVCVAEDSFPVVIERLQGNLRGMKQSLGNFQHSFNTDAKNDFARNAFILIFQVSGVESDIPNLPHNINDYLPASAGAIRNVSMLIDEIDHHFVSAVSSEKVAALAQMAHLTNGQENYHHLALNGLLGLFKDTVEKVFKPYQGRLIEWVENVKPGSPGSMMVGDLIGQADINAVSLYKLTNALIDIRDTDGRKLGEETLGRINDLVKSVCTVGFSIKCSPAGPSCDRKTSDVDKFLSNCHK